MVKLRKQLPSVDDPGRILNSYFCLEPLKLLLQSQFVCSYLTPIAILWLYLGISPTMKQTIFLVDTSGIVFVRASDVIQVNFGTRP